MNTTPERYPFRNGEERNGTIAFPCEQGLNLREFNIKAAFGFNTIENRHHGRSILQNDLTIYAFN